MKKIYGVMCLFVFFSFGSTTAISGWFEDTDPLPETRYLMFNRDAVGFVSRKSGFYGDSQKPAKKDGSRDDSSDVTFYFIYERGNRKIVEVDAEQFEKRFPGKPPINDPIQGPSDPYVIGHTSNGIEYKLRMKYCGEGVTDDIREVIVNNNIVNVRSRNECSSVSVVEIVSDQLWLGTAYSGEGGTSGAEGVIVQKLNSNAVLARLATNGAVIQINTDPFSNNVWVVTDKGIYEISPQFKILSVNLYSPEFESSSGKPRFAFSTKATHGNPLSIISRRLPITDRKSFYEALSEIPQADLKSFSLYNFFMGCSPANDVSPGSHSVEWPKSFKPLFPFFIKVNPQCASLDHTK